MISAGDICCYPKDQGDEKLGLSGVKPTVNKYLGWA